MKRKTALIIGAGPAGLTAAYELATRTKIKPIIIEKNSYVGGLSATINYKGNCIDIGGHRFFTKSDRVLNFWFTFLKPENDGIDELLITYHNSHRQIFLHSNPQINNSDVFLVRKRQSRIYYQKNFFQYPIEANFDTLKKLGFKKSLLIILSYLKSKALPTKPTKNLEDFYINQFGEVLYQTFFKSYTEKLWGTACNNISAEWGPQRTKGLSVWKTISHSIAKSISFLNRNTETSLIEYFIYPKYGPGQLWEKVAKKSKEYGATLLFNSTPLSLIRKNNKIVAIKIRGNDNKIKTIAVDYVFSSAAVSDIVPLIKNKPPDKIVKIATNLEYRAFIIVGLLLHKLGTPLKNNISDNWIYIHEPEVDVGRIQIFNNWSPYMVKDPNTYWVGLEYFCAVNDNLWKLSKQELISKATLELAKIGLASSKDVVDGTVIKEEKAYPSYTGSYQDFNRVKNYLDKIDNLFLIGRNGMHKYNNQDHSMLTAMVAVDNIINKTQGKQNIWSINTEKDYHEKK